MPKLPRISGAAIVKALERPGFTKLHQSGSRADAPAAARRSIFTLGMLIPIAIVGVLFCALHAFINSEGELEHFTERFIGYSIIFLILFCFEIYRSRYSPKATKLALSSWLWFRRLLGLAGAGISLTLSFLLFRQNDHAQDNIGQAIFLLALAAVFAGIALASDRKSHRG